MKKFTMLLTILGLSITVPVMASVSIEETTDAEYLINSGYSQVTAEDVFMLKNRSTGKPIEPLYEKSQNKFVKICKKIYAYIDPTIDDQDSRLHHDTQLSPSISDL